MKKKTYTDTELEALLHTYYSGSAPGEYPTSLPPEAVPSASVLSRRLPRSRRILLLAATLALLLTTVLLVLPAALRGNRPIPPEPETSSGDSGNSGEGSSGSSSEPDSESYFHTYDCPLYLEPSEQLEIESIPNAWDWFRCYEEDAEYNLYIRGFQRLDIRYGNELIPVDDALRRQLLTVRELLEMADTDAQNRLIQKDTLPDGSVEYVYDSFTLIHVNTRFQNRLADGSEACFRLETVVFVRKGETLSGIRDSLYYRLASDLGEVFFRPEEKEYLDAFNAKNWPKDGNPTGVKFFLVSFTLPGNVDLRGNLPLPETRFMAEGALLEGLEQECRGYRILDFLLGKEDGLHRITALPLAESAWPFLTVVTRVEPADEAEQVYKIDIHSDGETCTLRSIPYALLLQEEELILPATVEQDGTCYRVTELGRKLLWMPDPAKQIRELRDGVWTSYWEGWEESVIDSVAVCKRLIIPEGVEKIHADAFANLRQLEEVVLPSSLYAVGDTVLAGCNALQTVSLPESLLQPSSDHPDAVSRCSFALLPRTVKILLDGKTELQGEDLKNFLARFAIVDFG